MVVVVVMVVVIVGVEAVLVSGSSYFSSSNSGGGNGGICSGCFRSNGDCVGYGLLIRSLIIMINLMKFMMKSVTGNCALAGCRHFSPLSPFPCLPNEAERK